MLGIGTLLDIKRMIGMATGYLAFLWLSISPGMIVTLAIAMFLLKKFFPNGQKTLGILLELYTTAKTKYALRKKERDS